MFSAEFRELLLKLLSSKEVIGTTVALILYVLLVNYVGSSRRRKIRIRKPLFPKKEKKPKSEADGKGQEGDEKEEDEPPPRRRM